MGRARARKPRRRRPEQAGRVFVQTLHGDRVPMPGVTPEQFDRVKELAQAGELHAAEVWVFVLAFLDLIGSRLDFEGWTGAEKAEFAVGFLGWVGFVAEDAWTAADDGAFAALLAEVTPDVR